MNTNKNSVRFTIDFINKKIIGTKASFAKAGKGYGDAYEELAAKIAAHPDFKLEEKAQKHQITRAKRTYHGMSFKFMTDYISIQENTEQLTKEYKAVKTMAENAGRSVYPITKKWFLDKFSTEAAPFDMAAASEAISEALIAGAVSSVSPAPIRISSSTSELSPAVNQ